MGLAAWRARDEGASSSKLVLEHRPEKQDANVLHEVLEGSGGRTQEPAYRKPRII
jgi:hypothetical protein